VSSVVIEKFTETSERRARSASSPASRATSADFVVMDRRTPGAARAASSTRRVTPKRASPGWYGSVAAPIATRRPLLRARVSSVTSAAGSAFLT